jgi:hypothetical protein
MKRTIATLTLASLAVVGGASAANAGVKWEKTNPAPAPVSAPSGRTWA